MKNINFSFIIPHKNCPELLQRCIDSIPVRDDIQIIVVDDNSDYEKKAKSERSDVEVFFLDANHSKGAGRARNIGLKQAKGKWLLFADADDYYSKELSQILEKYATDKTTDIVYLNACVFDEFGSIKPFKTDSLIENYLNGLKSAEMDLKYDLWTPWSRMVKKNIVDNNKILFDELPAGNDIIFCLNCSKFSNVLKAEKEVVYNYFKSSQGSLTDKKRKDMYETRLALRGRMIMLYKEVGYKYSTELFSLFLSNRKNYSFFEAVSQYRNCLRNFKISFFSDFAIYLRNMLR